MFRPSSGHFCAVCARSAAGTACFPCALAARALFSRAVSYSAAFVAVLQAPASVLRELILAKTPTRRSGGAGGGPVGPGQSSFGHARALLQCCSSFVSWNLVALARSTRDPSLAASSRMSRPLFPLQSASTRPWSPLASSSAVKGPQPRARRSAGRAASIAPCCARASTHSALPPSPFASRGPRVRAHLSHLLLRPPVLLPSQPCVTPGSLFALSLCAVCVVCSLCGDGGAATARSKGRQLGRRAARRALLPQHQQQPNARILL